MRYSTLISAAAFFELSIAGYVLEDDYMTDFYGNFDFFTGADPTEGFVKYVDEATARQTNLINGSSASAVQFGVDFQNKTPKGRPSIRIESKKKYDNGLIVLDVAHMPFGCGTWPAFWTIGPDWPTGGEIDILEGVNEYTNNGMTLHTAPGCEIGSDTTQFSGELSTGNCDVNADGQGKNVGCSIKSPSTQSYGAGLNKIGGGVYATEWTSEAISVYFFPRGSIPADVLGDNPEPSGWGKPAAKFTGDCNIEKMFTQQQIVIDTTFCGQWAGSASVWNTGSCAKKAATCNEFVRDNPQAFKEAYWKINGLKVYQDNGQAPVAPSASAVPSKSIAISVSAPAVSINSTFPTIAPPKSSGVVPPLLTSRTVLGGPSETIKAPTSQVPTTNVSATSVPSAGLQSSRTHGSSSSRKPSTTINTQIAAPSGANGMANDWQWPIVADEQPEAPAGNTTRPASSPKASGTPAKNTTGAVAAPTTVQNIAQPSSAPAVSKPAAPAQDSDAPPAIPYVPKGTNVVGEIQTVYQTVYITVPAAAEPTPAPDAQKARMARHIREHRRRWTQHNARL